MVRAAAPASCWKQIARTSSAKWVRRGRPRRRSAGPSDSTSGANRGSWPCQRRRSPRSPHAGPRAAPIRDGRFRPTRPVACPGAPPSRWSVRAAPSRRRVVARRVRRWRRRRGDARQRRRPTTGADAGHPGAVPPVVHRDGEADRHRSGGVRLADGRGTVTRVRESVALRPDRAVVEGHPGVPGEASSAGRVGAGAAAGAPERQHRLGEGLRRHAHPQPVPHQGRARPSTRSPSPTAPTSSTPARSPSAPPTRRCPTPASRPPRRPASTTSASCSRRPTPTRSTARTPTGSRATPTRSTRSPVATPRSASTATTTPRSSARTPPTAASAWTTPPSPCWPSNCPSARRSTSSPDAMLAAHASRCSVPS